MEDIKNFIEYKFNEQNRLIENLIKNILKLNLVNKINILKVVYLNIKTD